MSNMRPWAVWRRSMYLSVLLAIVVFFGASTYFANYYTPANCFDGVRNGSELGVDCGGNCVRICAASVQAPSVVWVNSFKITEGQYNSVAYIENPNQLAGSPEVAYTITLKNGSETVAERSGVTILPPNSVYPIFEGRVFTDNQSPITETLISIESPKVWVPATVGADQFRTRDIELSNADDQPRLDVTLENTTLEVADAVEVVATIFNADGQPVAASQTLIDQFQPETVEDIVFTWPNSIAKTVRSCIVPTDILMVIDLSGSMNNDGDNPPQPLTDALNAASSFAGNLSTEDKLGLVTFASDGRLDSPLTGTHVQVANTILDLTIAPESETGFTNTVAALELAEAELNSANHNPDARRVLVMLTDGLPTDPDDERDIIIEAESLANQLDLSGIDMYAIGLGDGVDQDFIRSIASDQGQAFFAPTGDDLAAAYTQITGALCETGPTRIDVIAKTEASFAPLR